jgi:hypothetical protein
MAKVFLVSFFSIMWWVNLFSQQEDVAQQLFSRAWHTLSDLGNKESLILTSKHTGKGDYWYASFLTSGKFMRCDSLVQDIAETDGGMQYARCQCDSAATYVLKGNKVKIVKNSTSYYYKIIQLPKDKNKMEKLEFSVLDPQLFYR